MYSVIRALVCAIIVGSIENESYMLLRSKSSKSKLSDSWNQLVRETVTTSIRRYSSTKIISKASKYDDYSSAAAAEYGNGWITSLRLLIDQELTKRSDYPNNNVEVLEDDLDDIVTGSKLDGDVNHNSNIPVREDHSHKVNVDENDSPRKKGKGTIRREVNNVLCEIKEYIKNGRKSEALGIFREKVNLLKLNFLETNFIATKMMGSFGSVGDWSVCGEILELLRNLESGPDSFSVSAAMSIYIK